MQWPFRLHLPDRRRAGGFVLAVAVELLLIVLLVVFGPGITRSPPKPKSDLTTITLPPDDPNSTEPDRAKKADNTPKPKSGSAPPSTLPPDVAPPQKAPPPPTPLPGVLPIELGAADISKIKGSGAGDTAGDGKDSKLAYGPGLGPGGMPYYNVEWYREPTMAELSGYFKKPQVGHRVATLVCRTAPNYHVENCRVLQESPVGSGFGRAMREASWQFLVRPPRRGGKSLIGAWVGVIIDLTFETTVIDKRRGPITGPKDPDDGPPADNQ